MKITFLLLSLMQRKQDLSFNGCLDLSYPSLERRPEEFSLYLPLVVNSFATMALKGLCRVTKEVRVSRNPAPGTKHRGVLLCLQASQAGCISTSHISWYQSFEWFAFRILVPVNSYKWALVLSCERSLHRHCLRRNWSLHSFLLMKLYSPSDHTQSLDG